jgi:2-oxoglutarate ferredoxin oxidoreductase subunit alpha
MDDLSIVLYGEAGQGIQTVENVLVRLLKISGYHVFATKEYMSRVRGGVNSTSIRVSSRPVSSYTERIDLLFALTQGDTKHLQKRISPQTVKLSQMANNITAVGVIAEILSIDHGLVENYVRQYFIKKDEAAIRSNLEAVNQGYALGRDLKFNNQILITGAEAIALGALAGGCNFISAYPMTPSTGIFTFLSQHAAEFDLISEQAEDEISAINMALGAWYAGARAMVNTSGGGFDLMQEGLSLAGMLESPLVISLAGRPGPATGLPTRTEQADLNLALYSGHGEFPRIIFAPGNLAQAFDLTQKAFNLADKYQVPVFVLSDQYLNDSYYNIPPPNLESAPVEKYFVQTAQDYKRYQLAENGISPRGIPGFGEGLVVQDSDEHDEQGHITEDLDLRVKMVEKRLKKLDGFKADEVLPELIGAQDYTTLILGWGSTRNIIENNATAQFGNLLKLYTGIDCEEKILKYNGLPFSVEEVKDKIEEIIKK